MRKRGTQVPDAYRDLATRGHRVRFAGWWMGESEQDRVIANWIDRTPNASIKIKSILYDYITGKMSKKQQARKHEQEEQTGNLVGDAGKALLDLDV